MSSYSGTKSKIDPQSILGGIGFFDEADFEREASLTSVAMAGTKGVSEAVIGLFQDITGIETKNDSGEEKQFSMTGSLEFTNKPKQEDQSQKKLEQLQKEQKDQKAANIKKDFFQALKEDQERAQRAKEKLLFEEEINDIATNLPTEQKNELLHYQAGYKDRSVYQRAELRKKLIEQRQKADKQQKEASIPSPAKRPSAMEGAFEGGNGTQGGGTANLSAQAVG